MVKYEGVVCWETLDDYGCVRIFRTKAFYQESLPCRLLSPQAFLTHSSQNIDDHFRVYRNRAEWHLNDAKVLTMNYDQSFLPRMVLFKPGTAAKSLEAMLGSVVKQANKNLSPLHKTWMRWHYKLGHLGFAHVKKLGLGGYLDKFALALDKLGLQPAPKCEACCYGKQVRTPDGTTTITKNPERTGALKIDQLKPGSRVFCDQLESHVKGRLLHTQGRELDRDRFCGSTVFCDAASNYIHVEHQVTLSAYETISSKTKFEQLAKEMGVTIDSYHTDNGVFKAQAFMEEITNNAQGIRFSGVGAKWQNGAAEGAIRLVVSKARTMMIHAALHWPEVDDKSLWPLAVSHAAYLYNNTPNPETGQAPIEVFSRSVSDFKALHNAHPWGCPVYVLEPRLTQAGGKIPKWQPRSRRGQYVGVSPVHAEDISLIRNLKTGYISPQYHIVFDDWFETVYSDDDEEPPEWENMCIYQRFQMQFEPGLTPPSLSNEWLDPAQSKSVESKGGRKLSQEVKSKDALDDKTFTAPAPPKETREPTQELLRHVLERKPPDKSPTTAAPPPKVPTPVPPPPAPDPIVHSTPQIETNLRRNPRRNARDQPIERLSPQHGTKSYTKLAATAAMLTAAMHKGATAHATPQLPSLTTALLHRQLLNQDPHNYFIEDLDPWTAQSMMAFTDPFAFKAKKNKDPDLPSIREALSGEHAEEFWKAMDKEIASLEAIDTWEVVPRSSMPKGARAIPGTWAFRIKRFPDGRLNKFKARWCVMGNRMEKGVHYDETYAPLVGWPTVRAAMLLAASNGWKSKSVDFTNAFCQAPQKNELFVELPQHYIPEGYIGQDVVLRLKKSLYGQADSPRIFWDFMKEGMGKIGFRPADSDPCLFIHEELPIMVLNYCDDQIWLSPDEALIDDYVSRLQKLGYALTMEDEGDMFAFLGIDFKRSGSTIELSQTGLIEKVIKATGLSDSKPKDTPAAREPLGADKDGIPLQEQWSYPAIVGMLLYISSNTRPDIQFAVHQVARFSHDPKQSHGQAVKRIVRYLLGTKDKGIQFVPDLNAGLDCYVDADFAGLYGYEEEQDPVSVRSRTGFVLTLFGCPIIWSSKLQTEITLSSTAAEYVAFSMAMRELLPMRALLEEMSTKLKLDLIKESLVRSTVFEDNQGCLSLVNVPKMSPRNKYLALKYHFFRSNIGEDKGIVAKYIKSAEQQADILTKGLPADQFRIIRKLLIGW